MAILMVAFKIFIGDGGENTEKEDEINWNIGSEGKGHRRGAHGGLVFREEGYGFDHACLPSCEVEWFTSS